MRVQSLKSGSRVLVPQCYIAETFFSRFLGLMGKTGIAENEAVLFPKCNSIHTFFMRFAIDVVLVDSQGRVIAVEEGVRPWRLLLPRRKARHVIEMKAQRGRQLGIAPGMELQIEGGWA